MVKLDFKAVYLEGFIFAVLYSWHVSFQLAGSHPYPNFFRGFVGQKIKSQRPWVGLNHQPFG